MICRFKKLGNVLKETLGIYVFTWTVRSVGTGPLSPSSSPSVITALILQKLGEDLAGPLLVVTLQTLQSLPGSPLS